jgi:Holliday junction resolvase
MKSATSKGREYESEVADLFTAAGFEVIENPKSARPRQSDLFARDAGADFLIEVKNQKKKIDVNDIDALRSRLERVSVDIVGIIFTTSKLTNPAIQTIEASRHREILVFIKEEIENVRSQRQNIRALIERKRTALRVQGKVWFSATNHLEFAEAKLPSSNVEFRIGKSISSYFEAKSSFAGALYASNIPDTGWGSVTGEGVRLSIQLALSSTTELRDVLGYLHKKFGLSKKGTFSILQTECGWHGSGAEEFVTAVEEWEERYERSSAKKFHHSEEFRYFDQFRNGWLELSAQQRVGLDLPKDTMLHESELVIQLPGIPVDGSPFIKLCQYVGNEWADFQYFTQRLTFTRRLKKPLPIKVVGAVVEKQEGAGNLARERRAVVGVEIPLPELNETDLLFCSLRHWHDDGDLVDRYDLQGIEVTLGGRGGVIRPFGTWNKMLKRSTRR